MGSCFSSNKFAGEGRTLSEPSPSARPAATTGGQRLGGATAATSPSNPPPPSSEPAAVTNGTSQADREARALAAERRMQAQASKGTSHGGKLSQQLNQQKAANPLTAKDADEPQRVVWD